MLALELERLLKERFGRDREKLGLVGRPVVIQRRPPIMSNVPAQPLVLLREHAAPRAQCARPQQRCAVRHAVFRIELMRELVQHDVFPIDGITRPADRVVPRDHDNAVAPRFAHQPDGGRYHLARSGRPGELRNESVRIHEHCSERRVARAFEMEQQQARSRRNRDLNLFGEGEPTASLEVFARQKYLHQPEQALLLVRPQRSSERDIALHDGVPRVRDRAGR